MTQLPLSLLTALEVAEVLRITPDQVLNLCRNGALRATKPGKQWLIDEADLVAYLAQGANAPTDVA